MNSDFDTAYIKGYQDYLKYSNGMEMDNPINKKLFDECKNQSKYFALGVVLSTILSPKPDENETPSKHEGKVQFTEKEVTPKRRHSNFGIKPKDPEFDFKELQNSPFAESLDKDDNNNNDAGEVKPKRKKRSLEKPSSVFL